MALVLPPNFRNDIQGKDTNLVPLIIIGNHVGEYGVVHQTWMNGSIKISTGADFPPAGNYGNAEVPYIYDMNVLPILLNVPSLKESIDIEKRNYKIASSTIDISNYEYNGERFSDLVSNLAIGKSLINTEVRIFWWSPSVGLVIPYDKNPDYSGDHAAFQVYFGVIRRYTHDDEKVKLVVEDRSQATLHKDLPLEKDYLGTGDDVPDKYKGKPKPMVYGHVDRSPCVFESRDKILIDTKTVTNSPTIDKFGYVVDPLFAYVDDNYINVVKEDQYTYTVDGDHLSDNKITLTPDIIGYETLYANGDDPQPEIIYKGFLLCRDSSSNFTITLSNTLEDKYGNTEDFDIPQGSLMRTIDGIFANNAVGWRGKRSYSGESEWGDIISSNRVNNLVVLYDSNNGNLAIDFRTIYTIHYQTHAEDIGREFLLLKLRFNFIPNYDHEGFPALIGLSINGYVLTDGVFVNEVPAHGLPYYHSGTINDYASVFQTHDTVNGEEPDAISGLSESYAYYHVFTELGDYLVGGDQAALYNWFNFKDVSGATGDTNPNAIFQISITEDHEGQKLTSYLDLDGSNVKEIELLREVKVEKFFNYKFYADVNGREMDGDNSPSAPTVIEHILREELYPDISIDTEEEIDDFDDWEYAFTVDKKINSKKLIEGIASASPYIPRFDNMGNFKFDVIKLIYDNSKHTIKEADIINFSFLRTPIEDVVTKIEFKYKWDYARDDFSKRRVLDIADFACPDAGYWESFVYYGLAETIPNDDGTLIHPESTLVIDDDRGKYIRDDHTAEKFVCWMMSWYCNQHLIMKVKLPLKYMDIEIGDIVEFDELLGGIAPYGINYKTGASEGSPTFQKFLPYFMAIETNKRLDYVEISCIQMHELKAEEAWNEPDLEDGIMTYNVGG